MTRVFAAIGRFSVRFRWPIVVAWLAAAVLASLFLPSLSSVTKANNTDFLPASAPSQQAADLATPFQRANLTPVTVIAVRTGKPLTLNDATALTSLAAALRAVPQVQVVRNLGLSPDGFAAELQTLADIPHGEQGASKTLVHDLRQAIGRVPLPAGLAIHLAGDIASQVDSQAQSGHTGSQVQLLSVLFIVVLLFVIFRAILAPLVTLLPAFLVVQIAGPVIAEATKIGLQVSQLSQLMLIVLLLGAGSDYGLFLVFRVREELRGGLAPRDAVAHSVARVGESITFSAGTVVAALLSLLLATFGVYQSLGAPLAIGIALMLMAGLTLLPALLAILGRAVFWPTRVRPGTPATGWWGRVSARVVRTPVVTLVIGLVLFGALAVISTANRPAGFGTALTAPAGSDSAAGNAAQAAHFPQLAANPTNLVFRVSQPVWGEPQGLAAVTTILAGSPLFTTVSGPIDPNGARLGATELIQLHRALGPAQALHALPP
ncbi:MAG: MMPL family transporter, partial [Mycobacteriales bacterium]